LSEPIQGLYGTKKQSNKAGLRMPPTAFVRSEKQKKSDESPCQSDECNRKLQLDANAVRQTSNNSCESALEQMPVHPGDMHVPATAKRHAARSVRCRGHKTVDFDLLINAFARIAEHAILCVNLVASCATARRVVFTENVAKIADQQLRYAMGMACLL